MVRFYNKASALWFFWNSQIVKNIQKESRLTDLATTNPEAAKTLQEAIDKLKSLNIDADKTNLDVQDDSHKMSHDEHVYHQLSNRPWSALYVAALFFFFISLGTLAFYAIQRASQAGWSPILFRVMEGITGYLLPGSIIVFVILVLCTMHLNHVFVWMDPEVVAHDEIIQGKESWLNKNAFILILLFLHMS